MNKNLEWIAKNVSDIPEDALCAQYKHDGLGELFWFQSGKAKEFEGCGEFVFDVEQIMQARRKLGLEPSGISEEDEEAAIQEHYERLNRPKEEYGAYFKDVRHIDTIDVYRVVSLFDCEKHGHAISHAAKKLLLTGARTGGKDMETEVREAIDSLHRWLEMREEDSRAL